jgi:hypothetical protein
MRWARCGSKSYATFVGEICAICREVKFESRYLACYESEWACLLDWKARMKIKLLRS